MMVPLSSALGRTRLLLKALCLVLLALTLSLPATGQDGGPTLKPAFPSDSWERIAIPEKAGYSNAKLEDLLSYVKGLETTGLMVVVSGRVLFEYGDVEQISYLASVRKSILAMLYGNYVQEGTIRLDKTLAELGMSDHGLTPEEQQATVEHLISARSGIYHPASNPGDNSADAPARGSQKSGAYFLYNNWDFNAAGGAFEKQTGRNLYDALQTDLAQPLGMRDFHRSRHRKTGDLRRSRYPAYHMHLSTRDMARVGYLMLRQGNWSGRQLIPRQWARKIVSLITPLKKMNPESVRKGNFGYGYMWWVWDGPQAKGAFQGAYSARGAYGQYITVLPALDLVVAHKTAVPPRRFVAWDAYQGILDRIAAAHCGSQCGAD